MAIVAGAPRCDICGAPHKACTAGYHSPHGGGAVIIDAPQLGETMSLERQSRTTPSGITYLVKVAPASATKAVSAPEQETPVKAPAAKGK